MIHDVYQAETNHFRSTNNYWYFHLDADPKTKKLIQFNKSELEGNENKFI